MFCPSIWFGESNLFGSPSIKISVSFSSSIHSPIQNNKLKREIRRIDLVKSFKVERNESQKKEKRI